MKRFYIGRLMAVLCAAAFLGSSSRTTMAMSSENNSNDNEEPPRNPYLADSAWPMTHRNPYNQGSALLPGPERNDRLYIDFTYLKFAVIGLLSTKPDVNGHSNLWFHTVVQTGKLLATDRGTEIVDTGTYVCVCVCVCVCVSEDRSFAGHDWWLLQRGNSDTIDVL
jgi:hypothetical protein